MNVDRVRAATPLMRRRFLRRCAVLAVGALPLSSCLYGFQGGGLPSHIRTVFIAPLENETPQFDLERLVASALLERVPRSLGLRTEGESTADAIIRGRITRYEDVAQNYRQGQAGQVEVLQHRVQITMTIQIVDVTRNEILYESTGVSGNGEYRPDTQTDEVARTRAIEMLIQTIIDGAQSQW